MKIRFAYVFIPNEIGCFVNANDDKFVMIAFAPWMESDKCWRFSGFSFVIIVRNANWKTAWKPVTYKTVTLYTDIVYMCVPVYMYTRTLCIHNCSRFRRVQSADCLPRAQPTTSLLRSPTSAFFILLFLYMRRVRARPSRYYNISRRIPTKRNKRAY